MYVHLTARDAVELVVVHLVVARSHGQTDAVLGAVDGVAADLNVGRLHDGDSGTLHVLDDVVCTRRGTMRTSEEKLGIKMARLEGVTSVSEARARHILRLCCI